MTGDLLCLLPFAIFWGAVLVNAVVGIIRDSRNPPPGW